MASTSYSLGQQDETAVYTTTKKQSLGSANKNSSFSKKTSKSIKSSKAVLEKKVEANENPPKTEKEKEQRAHHLYELWSQAKQEEKAEYSNYLKEKVSLQHELIKQQDQLFRKRQEKLEEKRNQMKEAKRLARLARSTEYAEFVRDAIALDKLTSSKLKSHARVISSHKPSPRQPCLVSEKTEASGDHVDSAKSEKRFMSGKLGLQTKEFAELLDLPLDAQLKNLLGSRADSFLNPAYRKGAKKIIDPVILNQNDGAIGAKELWSILRHRSWMKLEREDALISQEVKDAYSSYMRDCIQRNTQPVVRSFCSNTSDLLPDEDQLSESLLLQDVYFTRHRLDLMFRIAQVNRDKTRLLFNSLGAVDTDGPRLIPGHSHKSRLEDSLRLSKVVEEKSEGTEMGNEVVTTIFPTSPQYKILPTLTNKVNSGSFPTVEKQPSTKKTVGTEKIVFLTEDMARCQGEFSKRLKAAGANDPGDSTKSDIPRIALNSRMTLSAPTATASMRTELQNRPTIWEPLSLNALLDYKKSAEAPGSGTFRNGQVPTWNVMR